MERRRFLGAVGAAAVVAGCLGGSNEKPATSEEGYETISKGGTEVPLVPIDTAYDWFEGESVTFADARSRTAYNSSHVEGAVLSPAPDGQPNNDPLAETPADRRIVTYCACPHSLSSSRAATLIQNDYEAVYALDEGFREWVDQEYPTAGSQAQARLGDYRVRGETDPADAGETVWARHRPTGQREPTEIAADGSYELHLPFVEVTPDSTVAVETPSYTVDAPLSELTSGLVTREGVVDDPQQA
ncbi:rhodanese-like domain-containing protein [Halorientalis halophila]|uniref:rhodanese-like domain-containing protein n=1 Tax=Halorientalis halophila TaxID=3108499 RepID=UPI003009B803